MNYIFVSFTMETIDGKEHEKQNVCGILQASITEAYRLPIVKAKAVGPCSQNCSAAHGSYPLQSFDHDLIIRQNCTTTYAYFILQTQCMDTDIYILFPHQHCILGNATGEDGMDGS